ncbi:MAG: SRPBCC family protein [Acidobacteriota bacterium]|nr:SRPBCC family protein [Acidobacteriota bacterium]
MKKVLVAIVALVALVGIAIGVLVLVTPTEFIVEREIEIEKPRAEVFVYLKEIKNQDAWGPWVKKDPNIKQSYEGNDGEVGFISKWESEHQDVGSGEQEIKKIIEGERIDTEIRFKKPFESTAEAYITTADAGTDKTKVKWGFTGSMPRPMNLMLLFIDMNAEVGKDFDEGLSSLKDIVEKQNSPAQDKEEPSSGEKSEGAEDL